MPFLKHVGMGCCPLSALRGSEGGRRTSLPPTLQNSYAHQWSLENGVVRPPLLALQFPCPTYFPSPPLCSHFLFQNNKNTTCTKTTKTTMSQVFGSWISESLKRELVFDAEPNPTDQIFETTMHIYSRISLKP